MQLIVQALEQTFSTTVRIRIFLEFFYEMTYRMISQKGTMTRCNSRNQVIMDDFSN